jgi:hypothetical protein
VFLLVWNALAVWILFVYGVLALSVQQRAWLQMCHSTLTSLLLLFCYFSAAAVATAFQRVCNFQLMFGETCPAPALRPTLPKKTCEAAVPTPVAAGAAAAAAPAAANATPAAAAAHAAAVPAAANVTPTAIAGK